MIIKSIINIFILSLSMVFICQGQDFLYEPSPEHPFGLPNPDAPKELLDFAPLIGECECKSLTRIDQNTWGDAVSMTWRFKYIMNGMAIKDETLKEDGKHAGSIRQFIRDSTRWFVHYYSSSTPSATLPAWEGNRYKEGKTSEFKGKYVIVWKKIEDDWKIYLDIWNSL